MTEDRAGDRHGVGEDRDRDRRAPPIPTDRESPVGAPVIRGDEAITGTRASGAVQFDPDDPDSLADAAATVREFAVGATGDEDHIYMLRGAAACAALVRGEGTYKAAAERARGVDAGNGSAADDGDVTVSFIRKWARVHDLPRAVRRQVALGNIAPTAAKHIARVGGEDRLLLAWATLDGDLTVREVRGVASAVTDGTPIDRALAARGVELGRLGITLPASVYRDLRREASLEGVDPDAIVADALAAHLGREDDRSDRPSGDRG